MIKKKSGQKKLTFVDLFAGIGGFHLGIMQAAKNLGFIPECVLAVDNNKHAQVTYGENFIGTQIMADITTPEVKNYVSHDVDIVCGGFPCQPFSQAGKKRGAEDDRGTLYKHILDILKDKKPKAVFLENVRNLQNIENNDGIKIIDVIREGLEDAGYPISIRTFRATEFGLPTHRPRIYLVGFRKDVLSDPNNFFWPKTKNSHGSLPKLDEYFCKLSKKWDGLIEREGWPNRVGSTLRVGGAGSGFRDNDTRRDRRNWDSYMFFENDIKKRHVHQLSINEAKAIMGFPANFRFSQVSKTQAMKQLGNSVAVPVISAIAKNIIKTIYG